MAELKTRPTDASVHDFLAGVENEAKRNDCFALVDLMERVTGEKAIMWGSSIVGFGTYRYRYASGREGDWPLTGFAPRKQDLTLYITSGFEQFDELMGRLGKHKTGQSCLYIKRLTDIDIAVLEELVGRSVEHMRATNL